MGCTLFVAAFLAGSGPADSGPDPAVARREAWAKSLAKEPPLAFPEAWNLALASAETYDGDCAVHIVKAPRATGLTVKFVRDGKDVVVLPGHAGSAFYSRNQKLYFAHYSPAASGCSVSAHDLATGKLLWHTRLEGLGPVAHAGYSNRVGLRVGYEAGGDYGVAVVGREKFGDYAEVLDPDTGKPLAHRVYVRKFDSLGQPLTQPAQAPGPAPISPAVPAVPASLPK